MKEIKHWGVKGMKWGVRKNRKSSKEPSVMKGKTINERIKRLKMERKLKSLIEADIDPGRAFIKNVLKTAGKDALKKLAEEQD